MLKYTTRPRSWHKLRLCAAVVLLALPMVLPAGATSGEGDEYRTGTEPPSGTGRSILSSNDPSGELLRLLQGAGVGITNTQEATNLVSGVGLSVAEALKLLRSDSRYVDTFVRPSVTVWSTRTGMAVPPQVAGTATGQQCGWAITQVSIKGGITRREVQWFRLRTDWCWSSNRRSIVGIPTHDPVTFGITSYGTVLGYNWTSDPSVDAHQWLLPDWKYRISTRGTSEVCPLNIDICFSPTQPWLIHDMFGNGTVGKRSGR